MGTFLLYVYLIGIGYTYRYTIAPVTQAPPFGRFILGAVWPVLAFIQLCEWGADGE